MYLDICLSDIPRERIKTAANGKKYLKAIIRPRQETDRDGYDHYIAAFVPKDERNGDRPAFIGRAQEKHYDDQQPAQQASRNTNTSRSSSGQQSSRQSESSDTDDLPF